MDTRLFYITGILLIAILNSCVKAKQDVCISDGTKQSFTALTEQMSKVSLEAFPSVLWQEEDCIMVFGDTAEALFNVRKGSISGTSCIFEGNLSSSPATVHALYPASSGVGYSSGKIRATLPSRQFIPAGCMVDPSAMLMVAGVTSSTLSFKNVCGFIKVTITGSDVTGIVISGLNGEPISGLIDITVSDSPEFTVVSGASLIDVRPEGYGTFVPGIYYIPVLPTSFSEGLSVGVRTAMCEERTIATTSSVQIPRNSGETFSSVNTMASTKEPVITVRCRHDFEEITTNGVLSVEAMVLGNDIDMEGVQWEPVAFGGSLEGRGHRIFNLVSNCVDTAGFISRIISPSNIQDVTFGSVDGQVWDGVSRIHSNAVQNGVVAAPVAFVGATSVLSGITNFIPVSADNARVAERPVILSGIVARWADGGSCRNCINEAEISNRVSIDGDNLVEGGIIGQLDLDGTTIFACQNRGALSNSGDIAATNQTVFMGGIIGKTGYSADVTSCTHAGSLTNIGAADYVIMGGIIGNADTNANKCLITDCINNGTVVNTGTVGVRGYFGGIVGCYAQSGSLLSCVNNGQISCNQKNNVFFAGGIIGFMPREASKMKGCGGFGAVLFNPNYSRTISGAVYDGYAFAGAVCGYHAGSISAWSAGGTVGGHLITDSDLEYETLAADNYKYVRGTYSAGPISVPLSGTGLAIDKLDENADSNAW